MFLVQYDKTASRFLKKLAVKDDLRRLMEAIEQLSANPFPKDAKRVEEFHDAKVFRVRVGDYRVLYVVDHSKSEIYIVKIDHRERVY